MPTTNPQPGQKASVFISTGVSTLQTNGSMTNAGDDKTFTVATSAQRYWDTTIAPVVQVEADEIQTVTITGSPTGGTFTLTVGANTTSTLNWNCTASQMQTALQALVSVGANNALVTGGPGPGTAFTVEFTAGKGFASQSLIVRANNSLTGGATPDVSITRAQAGFTWTTQAASTYSVQYVGGIVTFATAFLGASVNARVTYNYLTVSQSMHAKSIEVQIQQDIYDVTTFASAGWKEKLAGVADATYKLSKWWIDGFYLSQMAPGALVLIAAYTGANANQRLEGYGYIKTDGIKFDVKAVEEESIDIEASGGLFYIAS